MRSLPSRRSLAVALVLAVSLAETGLPVIAQSPVPASPGPAPTTRPAASAAPFPSEPPAVLAALALPGEGELATDLGLEPPVGPEIADLSSMDPARLEEGLTAAVLALPPSAWTIEGLAAAMDFDPVQPFLFVRDRIGFQPYAGVLRGAEGTLTARAGNSWDRALLLAALLDAMAIPTRLAWGDLDPTTAATLTTRGLEAPTAGVADGDLPLATGVRVDAIGVRARRDHAALRAVLGDRLGTLAGDETAAATADVGSHAWVQAHVGPDWVDLDPSLPRALPGSTLTAVTATGDTPPDGQRQAVQLTLTAEQLDPTSGTLTEQVVLDQRLDAATTAPEIMTLSFVPSTDQLGQTITNLFTGVDQWKVVLGVADQQFVGSSFTVGGTGTDLFGDTTDAPPLTALRLSVTATAPGRDPVTASTILLDRVPPAARAAGTVTEEDLAPLVADKTGPAALSRITHVLLSTGGADAARHVGELGAAWAYVNDVLLDPELADRQQLSDILRPLMVMDDQLVLASELVSVPALRDPGRIGAFVAAPRVSLVTFGPGDAPDQNLFRTDLVLDDVRILADPSVPAADVAARRLWYGTLQSAIETQLVRDRGATDDPTGVVLAGASYNTSKDMVVLDEAAASGRGDLPPALVAGLTDGGLAVIPAGTAPIDAWWAIDADGMTRAMLAPTFGGGGLYGPGAYKGVRNLPRVPVKQSGGSGGVYDLSKPTRPARNVPVGNTCRGGSEYSTILGCVSIPGALVFRILLATAIDAVIFAVIYGAFKAVEASSAAD